MAKRTVRLRIKQLRQRLPMLREGSFAHETLRYAAAGTLVIGLVGIMVVAPGLSYAGKLFLVPHEQEKYRRHRERIREAMRRLEKKRLVRLVPHTQGIAVQITEFGQETLRYSSRTLLRPKKVKRWDGIWRVVLFDVPEDSRVARDALRRMLRHVGFFQLQKSVFVTPYPCRKEVETIAGFFSVEPYVIFLETDDLGLQERPTRSFFGLS